jgi:hypothetical protein
VAGGSATWRLKADARELVIELSDGTRLIARAEERLDISVT